MVAQRLSQILGQSIVIENRAGAGGTIANTAAARAAPDGYTLLFATAGTYVQSAALYKNLSYDIERDFIAVSQMLVQPLVMSTSLGSPPNLKDFVAYAKANPGKMNYGSAGHATSGHLTGLLFSKVAGINAVHVPFRAASAVSTAMMQNEVQYFFDTAFTASRMSTPAGCACWASPATGAATRCRTCRPSSRRAMRASPRRPGPASWCLPARHARSWNGSQRHRRKRSRPRRCRPPSRNSTPARSAIRRRSSQALIAEELKKWKAIAAEFNITVD